MKKQLFLAIMVLGTVTIKAQNASITLSNEQYAQIKKTIQQEQRKEKMASLDWAQFNRYAEANAELKHTPKVVFMGNSITDNWARMRPDFFKNNNFLGRGISGQTSCEMLVRFRADVINLHPKYVIINSGTNDVAHNNGIILKENVLQNIISMAELAKVNHIIPILSSILPTNHFSWSPVKPADEVIALNAMIKQYAVKNKIKYIDYYSAMVDDQKGLPEKYSKDGVHPIPNGYVVMEKLVLQTIK